MKNKFYSIWIIGVFAVFNNACSSLDFLPGNWSFVQKKHQLSQFNTQWIELDASIAEDQELRTILFPYRAQLDSIMQKPLAVLKAPLTLERGKTSSSLANVLADQLRSFASAQKRSRVDVAVLNRGGIRLPMLSDTVKVGTLYELMPFENTLVYLNLKGNQLITLANELAQVGGEAVSGLRFTIDGNKAKNILVGNKEIDRNEVYTLATINYLVEGGGNMQTLWQIDQIEFTSILIRDIYIRSFYQNNSIEPIHDDRIRWAESQEVE